MNSPKELGSLHMSHPEQNKTLLLLSKLFKTYYLKADLYLPADIDKREFAIQPLGKDTYVRHLSFKSETDFRRYITQNVPANAFYSSALFLFPDLKDMDQKGWIGSELLFDIDADALPNCEGTIKNVCMSCGFSYPGINECPQCGSKNIVEAESVSDKCLSSASLQTVKLIDILKRDFGFKDITVTFTGNRGFHVRVRCDKKCMNLTSEERREIASYIKGIGLDTEILHVPKGGKKEKSRYVPHPTDGGWRGRIGWELYTSNNLDMNKRYTINELLNLNIKYDVEDLVRKALIYIDEKVTMDIHRLIRIPGSLHGKTGLPSIILSYDKILDFKLSCDLSPFKGKLTIIPLVDLVDITVFDKNLNLKKGDKKTIEHCYAIFLLLRGLVTVA